MIEIDVGRKIGELYNNHNQLKTLLSALEEEHFDNPQTPVATENMAKLLNQIGDHIYELNIYAASIDRSLASRELPKDRDEVALPEPVYYGDGSVQLNFYTEIIEVTK